MRLFERVLTQTATDGRIGPLEDIGRMVARQVRDDQTPIRFAVTESSRNSFRYEIGILDGSEPVGPHQCSTFIPAAMRTRARSTLCSSCLPASARRSADMPVTRLRSRSSLASVCDTLITHPNVVNASDLNEMPANGLYVEGSLLSRFLLG